MKLISLKLWLTERNYPLVPVIEMPGLVHITLLCLFFILALWLFLKPEHRYVMLALLVTESITLLGDQNRLQPWHYQFLFTIFTIVAIPNRQKALQGIALITIATYFFSGLQKLNPGFLDSIWSYYMLQVFLKVPSNIIHHQYVHFAGLIIPLIEIGGAICLLFSKTMNAAVIMLLGMHVFILLFLGPLGINYNVVVWPWNIQMMIVLYILFVKGKILLRPASLTTFSHLIIAIFWLVMPIAGLLGYWDKFLSSGMYSGKKKPVQFFFEDRNNLPAELKKYAFYSKKNASARIVLTDWSVSELNVAAVSEPRMYKSITAQLNKKYASQNVHFKLTEIP